MKNNFLSQEIILKDSRECNAFKPAIYALQRFQEQMKGEGAKVGLLTDENVANWITASRRKEEAE